MLTYLAVYLLFGAAWVGICVLTGSFQIRAERPGLALLFMVSVWPYLVYRIFRNIVRGTPDGDIWP